MPARTSPENTERALITLAACGGNSVKASRELAEHDGVRIAARTLRQWRTDTHAAHYKALAVQHRSAILDRIGAEAQAHALRQGELETAIEDHLEQQIPGLKPGEAATALRNVTVSKGINNDKAALAAGRPTEIHAEHRSPEEILLQIKARWPWMIADDDPPAIEGTAEDVTEPPAIEGTSEP